MFGKLISQLTEEDIQTLVDNNEKESSILEYKQELSGTEPEKKEISKDVSAMANSEGGYLIIGVQEQDGRASAVVGTPKRIGRQPTEEWLESVLISNVRPRITIKPKVIDIASDPDRVVIIVHIPQSPRRPHMVVADGRNAYYKRHNYQSAYADEHDVRSMFLESKTSIDEMKEFLRGRNLDDQKKENFALTPLSEDIANTLIKIREVPESYQGKPFVLFASCPRYLEERVDIASADFREWLNQRDQIDLFGLNIDFLDYNKEITSDSIRSIKAYPNEEGNRIPIRYIEVFRNGYIENGLGAEFMWSHKELGLMLQIAWFTAAFWLFMKFIKDTYAKLDYLDEISIIVALSDIKGITLHGFGNKNEKIKWTNPYDLSRGLDRLPTAKQKNFRFEKNIIISELGEQEIEDIVKDVALRVSNAFGETIAKCFDDNGHFDRNQLGGFRNIRGG